MLKKILLLLSASFVLHVCVANVNHFELNENELDAEFSELNKLEEAVFANPSMGLEQAQEMNLLMDDFNSASADGLQSSEFSFQWEGFLWGFLCCPVGVFVVALNKHKTKDNKTSFWIGVAGRVVFNTILMYSSGNQVYYTY